MNDSYEKLALTQGLDYTQSIKSFDRYLNEFKRIEEKLKQFESEAADFILKAFRELVHIHGPGHGGAAGSIQVQAEA